MTNQIFNNLKDNSSFLQNGFVVLDLLSDQDIKDLKQIFAKVEDQHKHDYVASVVLNDVDMRRFINDEISQIFRQKILPVLVDYKIVLGSFVAKKASSSKGKFPLHQDPTFVDEDQNVGLSIWCPLVDVDTQNGCLGVMPGSQHLNNPYRTAGMLPYPEWVNIIESQFMRYIPMKAGQVMFMNTRMIHGSPTNVSENIRPVAVGVGIPKNKSLLCCYVDEVSIPKTTHVFNVPDDFYITHTMRSYPQQGTPYKTIEHTVEPINLQKIEDLVMAFHQSAIIE
jgi:hypothetical protein